MAEKPRIRLDWRACLGSLASDCVIFLSYPFHARVIPFLLYFALSDFYGFQLGDGSGLVSPDILVFL